MKFKVGDRVRHLQTGDEDVVVLTPGMCEYDSKRYGDAKEGFVSLRHSWEYQRNWELVREQRENYTVSQTNISDIYRKFMLRGDWDKQFIGWDYGYETIEETTKPKKTIMKTLGTMMKKLLDADTQTLVKAGFINGDLELTSEGKDELIAIMFSSQKSALVEIAQAKLDAQER